jgi:hypothetical protein
MHLLDPMLAADDSWRATLADGEQVGRLVGMDREADTLGACNGVEGDQGCTLDAASD